MAVLGPANFNKELENLHEHHDNFLALIKDVKTEENKLSFYEYVDLYYKRTEYDKK